MNMHSIRDRDDLEDRLSTPTAGLLATFTRLEGDVIVLGVGGKMGPTLARMAKRASDLVGMPRRVIGVARFSEPDLAERLQAVGVEPISCDLLNEEALGNLPEAPNLVYMAGRKFGTMGQESATWAMNAYLPGPVCRKYRKSRIVVFSTGNVYGPVHLDSGGSRESDSLAPLGEYAMSCLGRERLFEHFSRTLNIPMAIIRLNYATEMRYGVLVDIAKNVLEGTPIDITTCALNAIWQGDANAMALQSFDHVGTPPTVLNLTGPETLDVRTVAETFGRLMNREVHFVGEPGQAALLNNANHIHSLFGKPQISANSMIPWVANWLTSGGSTLGKPTHFEAKDGHF